MYQSTTKTYLYYKYNNTYYRIPTHGKVFKIIDFGRAILNVNNRVYMNDVFSKHGEAGGQYSYPSRMNFKNEKDKKDIQPNYNFDLCRLSMTILDELNRDNISLETVNLLRLLCSYKDGYFRDMEDDFRLYIEIADKACYSLPRNVIRYDNFKKFRVKKNLFPKKSYYTI